MALAPSTLQTHDFWLSPNTLYYSVLYLMVIMVRYFKLRKEEAGPGWSKHSRKEVMHVGLEVVYTASGLVILLLNDLKDYGAFIFVAYVMLVLASSQVESMEEKFSKLQVFWVHMTIILVVVSTTVLYFQWSALQTTPERKAGMATYKVSIPYQDFSLREHLGAAYGARQLVFITEIEAHDEFEAKALAKEKMSKEIRPFESRRRRQDSPPSPDQVVMNQEQIMLKKLHENDH